jgi:hypothetical protein
MSSSISLIVLKSLFSYTSLSLMFVTVELFVAFWSSYIDMFFIFLVSALGFIRLRTSCWLEVSITCNLSVEVFSMFSQESLTAGLGC